MRRRRPRDGPRLWPASASARHPTGRRGSPRWKTVSWSMICVSIRSNWRCRTESCVRPSVRSTRLEPSTSTPTIWRLLAKGLPQDHLGLLPVADISNRHSHERPTIELGRHQRRNANPPEPIPARGHAQIAIHGFAELNQLLPMEMKQIQVFGQDESRERDRDQGGAGEA